MSANDHWKLRAIHATRGNQTQMGSIILAIIGHVPSKRPYFKGLANIDKEGIIWCLFYSRSIITPKMVPVCHVSQYNDQLKALADACQMDDREANELFSEARKWIERDARAKSVLN